MYLPPLQILLGNDVTLTICHCGHDHSALSDCRTYMRQLGKNGLFNFCFYIVFTCPLMPAVIKLCF